MRVFCFVKLLHYCEIITYYCEIIAYCCEIIASIFGKTLQALLEFVYGIKYYVTGDRIQYDQPAIIIMNHRTRLGLLSLII